MTGKRGSETGYWKGGRTSTPAGYIRIRVPEHPFAREGYVFEHRLVMERIIGRYLDPIETVHHRNGQRDDNRPENLELRAKAHGAGMTHCPHCGESLTPHGA